MSRPWMPLYVADYLADTRRLSTIEHGAYLLLIMDYWQNGGLPDDDAKLARIAGMTDKQWREARLSIAPMFQEGWKHKRIDEELAMATAKQERRQEAGRRGGLAKAQNQSSNATILPEKNDSKTLARAGVPQSQSQIEVLTHTGLDDPPVARVGEPEADFRQAIVQKFAPTGKIPDTSHAVIWLKRGFDPEICLAVIGDGLSRRPSINSLKYFDQAIADAHVAPKGNARAGPPANGKPSPKFAGIMSYLDDLHASKPHPDQGGTHPAGAAVREGGNGAGVVSLSADEWRDCGQPRPAA